VPSPSPFAEQVQREVAACIGCHDCLLACPLPEAGLVSIAELNAAVRSPVIRGASVIRFLTACTQCRQCVPACPADLSRADMVLFNKMKVEDTVPDRLLLFQVGQKVEPSPFTLDALAREVAALRLLRGVPPEDVRRLLLEVTLRRLGAGERLFGEGEYHQRLVIVLSGALQQIAGGVRILVLGPGSFLGEMAVMADQPEPFAVMARSASVIVEAPKAAVHRLMHTAPAFRATMEALYARRAVFSYAARAGALGGLPEPAIEELLASATLGPLAAGQVLVREGAPPEDVYLVRAGFLRVTRHVGSASGAEPDEVLAYFREGDLFGALPLLLGERGLLFTVRAVGRAEVIRIPGAALRRVLDRHPESLSLWTSDALSAERSARSRLLPPTRPAPAAPAAAVPAYGSVAQRLSFDVLVEHGLAEGRELLVVDQTRCTHCNACVDACGRRHGMSRLELRGIQVEHLLFPTACRHCDDPVCLLCSVNGIVRRPSGEIAIVEDQCIGCGACAERCPYGNIRMHPAEPEPRGVWRRFLDYLRGPEDAALPGELDPGVPRKAVKCDLCADHDDYACVTACPVGAAFRADPDVFAGVRGR
jgi:Fe-S-cluster-containing dehydrogenase component/CRP-like cAMP-binding protein